MNASNQQNKKEFGVFLTSPIACACHQKYVARVLVKISAAITDAHSLVTKMYLAFLL